MKKIGLCLVGLILALAFTQIVETSFYASSYDFMADVNRDNVVDVNDLARLGKAYGSSLVLPSIPNKTVVTVLSFDKEPPEVENARVAIVDPETLDNQYDNPINVTYTNSSGIATFDLGPDQNYTALTWSGSAYNYANLTTNSLGEASVLILLAEPSLPPVRVLPRGWVVVTVINNQTGSLYVGLCILVVDNIEYNPAENCYARTEVVARACYGGVVVLPPAYPVNNPHSKYGLLFVDQWGYRNCTVYSPDVNGCTNVVLLVTPR